MIKKYISKPIYLQLFTLLLLNSCGGQTKTELQTDRVNQPIGTLIGQPKMIKSQGVYKNHTATGPYSDTSVSVSAIIEDKNGDIWASTMGEGVYRYDGQSFTNYTMNDGLITNLVYSMMEDVDGNIWFGTTDGISKYNGESFTNFSYSVIKGNSYQFIENNNDPLKKVFKEYKEVWCMLQDKIGRIWLGTTNGVYCFDGERFSSIAELDPSKNNSLKHLTVNSIAEDKEGNIWFTSWTDGLCRFDGKSITKVSPNGEGFNSMLLDSHGNIWLGRRDDKDGGVYRYDGKTFTKMLIGMPYITKMEEDKNGTLWFSNAPNGGVIHYNPSTSEIIARFTNKDGLPNNHISAITIGKSGIVWFGMNDLTLTRFDGKTFVNY